MTRKASGASFALSVALLLGCGGGSDREVTEEDVQRESKEAIETAGQYAEQKRKQVAAELEAELRRLEENWEPLRERARREGEQALAELEWQIEQSKPKLEQAREMLDQLKNEGGAAWQRLRERLEQTVQELEQDQGRTGQDAQDDR